MSVAWCRLLDDIHAVLAEPARVRDHRDLGDPVLLQALERERHDQAVRPRRLEHELVELGGDDGPARDGHLRDARAIHIAAHAHRLASAGGPDECYDLLLLDQLDRSRLGLGRIGRVVLDEELDLRAVHAAGRVDRRDLHLKRVLLGRAEARVRAGQRQHRTDLDRRLDLCGRIALRRVRRRRAARDSEHGHHHGRQ
jgi:hypothetical protein